MILCSQCIEAIRSRGETLFSADDIICTAEESEEENQPCDWCGEFDDLTFCWMKQGDRIYV